MCRRYAASLNSEYATRLLPVVSCMCRPLRTRTPLQNLSVANFHSSPIFSRCDRGRLLDASQRGLLDHNQLRGVQSYSLSRSLLTHFHQVLLYIGMPLICAVEIW